MKPGTVRSVLAYVLPALAAALALAYAFWPKPIDVDIAQAERGALQVSIQEDGEIRAHDRYTITAPVTGRLLRVSYRDGDRVSGGQVLATLVPTPMTPGENATQRARVDAAEALLEEAKARAAHVSADLAQARRELARARALAAAGAISEQEFEQLRLTEASTASDFAAQRARQISAEADARAARANLKALEAGQSIDVRAPVDGVLLRIDEKSERVVSAGTPLMVLADPARYEVVIDVLSADAVKIRPGMPVSVEDWGGADAIHARVRVIEPGAFTKISALGVEEQRVHVVADLTDPAGRLSDGYRVQGRIILWEQPNVLKLPIGALFRSGQQWVVFSVENGRAVLRTVQIGQRSAEEVQIISGVPDHATVVLYPPNTLRPGDRVHLLSPGEVSGQGR